MATKESRRERIEKLKTTRDEAIRELDRELELDQVGAAGTRGLIEPDEGGGGPGPGQTGP